MSSHLIVKGIAIFGGLALVAGASAQVGEYTSVNGGYRVAMSIKPKGIWSFRTQFMNKPNKTGSGRWTKKGRQLHCVVYMNGKPLRGPEGSGILTISPDGQTMTQKTGGQTFVFRKIPSGKKR